MSIRFFIQDCLSRRTLSLTEVVQLEKERYCDHLKMVKSEGVVPSKERVREMLHSISKSSSTKLVLKKSYWDTRELLKLKVPPCVDNILRRERLWAAEVLANEIDIDWLENAVTPVAFLKWLQKTPHPTKQALQNQVYYLQEGCFKDCASSAIAGKAHIAAEKMFTELLNRHYACPYLDDLPNKRLGFTKLLELLKDEELPECALEVIKTQQLWSRETLRRAIKLYLLESENV